MNIPAIERLKQKLLDYRLDAILINNQVNMSYLSGFNGEGLLVITPNRQILMVDARFIEQAPKQAKSFQIWQRKQFRPLEKSILVLVKKLKLKSMQLLSCVTC